MGRKNIIIMRVILWLILAVILTFFIYFKIVPTGKISYVYDFSQLNYFIGKLAPPARVELNKRGAEIKGDPVYFSLKTPRRFAKAKVTVKFKNTTNFPVMEIGLLNDKVAWGYDLKPLQNKIIDQLALVWPVVYGQDGVRLIEREKKYNTVEQFLSDLPESQEIALYDYSLKTKFQLDSYQPKQANQVIDYGFRGSYQFYTYIKNEDLNYLWNFIDLNINQDSDQVDIKVYSPDGLIYSARAADDKAGSNERQAAIKIADLPEGVYRLSIIANDDIITKSIISPQSQFALINKVWLAQGDKKNTVLFTNSRQVSAQTINPASLEKIKIGTGVIDLNQTYKQFSLKTPSQPVKIELAKDDIIISGDGVFSFSQGSLLDPRFKNIDRNIGINQEKINYILTNYQTPAESEGWQTATADFDLTKAYQENSKYQFLISLPGLKAEELTEGAVTIKEIKVDLQGTSLWRKVKKYFNR